ncbi:MAG: methylated-DNA--[protein]-cysteine S-methyltransferase [Peptococcaceae bacterium]|nr:methylated-DNA--[protein]-cysteine S-methyltransferase [Peptococcaceae bacterium]
MIGTPHLEVKYWVEPVTLLETCYTLVTASVGRNVVYCSLQRPLSSAAEHVRNLPKDLRHAGEFQLVQDDSANHETVEQVKEYLMGHRRDFTLPLHLYGTDFQKKVWRELLKIPYGTTKSYGDIARAVGTPRGPRAVGMANNRNPLGLIIPCHRVIGKNGDLVGYDGGVDIKAKLLALEKTAI